MDRKFATGSFIGPYTIIRIIGRGGMGEVYEAFDTLLNRKVALKVISQEGIEKVPDALRRFIQEGKAMAQFSHPNIATLHHFGVDKGTHFIAMEYVEGVSLHEYLKDAQQDVVHRLFIFGQILKGVQALHRKSIIHGDIKPKNIIIQNDATIKLIDFGIAHINWEMQDDDQPVKILGSAHYMAPEISEGAVPNVQSEIWSLGIILYQLLANERPFTGDTPDEVREKARQGSVQFSFVDDWKTPKKYQDVIRKMCERSLEDRYQSIAQILEDLDEDDFSTVPVRPHVWWKQVTFGLAISFVLLASAVVLNPLLMKKAEIVAVKPRPIVRPVPVVVTPPAVPKPAEVVKVKAPEPVIVPAQALVSAKRAPASTKTKTKKKLARPARKKIEPKQKSKIKNQ